MAPEEWSSLLNAVEARLRLVQADLADADAAARRSHLAEELQRALKLVAPEHRTAFMEALESRFPMMGIGPAEAASAKPQVRTETKTVIQRAPITDYAWDELLREFLRRIAGLKPDEREKAIDELRRAGMTPPAEGGMPPDAITILRKALDLEPTAKLDMIRLSRMIATLVNFAASLDPLTWNVWRAVASGGSKIHAPARFEAAAHSYALGQPNDHFEDSVKRLQQLISALLSAISRLGEDLSDHLEKVASPQAIEDFLKLKGTIWPSDSKRWARYGEVYGGTMNGNAIDAKVRELMAEKVKKLLDAAG